MTIFIPFRVFVWRPPVVFLLLLFLLVSLLVPRNHRSVRDHARAPLLPLALSFSPPQVYYPRVRGAKNTESPKTDVKIALGVTESAGSVGESRLKKGYSQVMARAPAGGSVGEPSFFSPHAPTIDHEMPARWSKPKKWKINICAFSCPPSPSLALPFFLPIGGQSLVVVVGRRDSGRIRRGSFRDAGAESATIAALSIKSNLFSMAPKSDGTPIRRSRSRGSIIPIRARSPLPSPSKKKKKARRYLYFSVIQWLLKIWWLRRLRRSEG